MPRSMNIGKCGETHNKCRQHRYGAGPPFRSFAATLRPLLKALAGPMRGMYMRQGLPILSGLVIPIWLFFGVLIAGSMNPGYSHLNQAMSELGAVGSPTHAISPVINNFPLGILFITFGISVAKTLSKSKLAVLSGILIVMHGLGSISAGYFSCDVGCNPESPSYSQIAHNLSGAIMFLSLTVAGCIWIYLGGKLLGSRALSWFSLVCTIVGLAVLPALPLAVESGHGFGLYQRINYGASVIWLSGLACVLLLHQRKAS